MARKNFNKRNKRRNKGSNTAKSLKSFAYRMGQVERGLKNPDSQISQSYERGQRKPSYSKKRPLF